MFDEGKKLSASRALKVSKLISPVSLLSQKKQPLTRMDDFPSSDREKSSLRSSEGDVKTFLTKNSAASRLAAKSSAVRSSCHDACKFGHHHTFAEPNGAQSRVKSVGKKSSKVSAAKVSRPAVPTAKINKSPVKSRDSGVSAKKSGLKLNSVCKSLDNVNTFSKSVKKLNSVNKSVENASLANKSGEKASSANKSGGKLTSVHKSGRTSVHKSGRTSVHKSGGRLSSVSSNGQLSGEKSVKSIRTNVSNPESKFKVTRSLFRTPRSPSGSESLKILTSKISMDDISSSVNFQPPKAARSLIPAFESPRFSSELSFKILDDKAEEEFFRQFSPMENAAKSHDEISFEAFSGDQSSEYSEISPRSMEAYLQEAYDYVGKTSAENAANAESMKMRFRKKREACNRESNVEPESVVLRHQDVQGRKPSELINHAIEEAVSKLSHTQKNKVKVLVGAFETVMNLKDSQNTDNDPEAFGIKGNPDSLSAGFSVN